MLPLKIAFTGEEGIDAGGLQREWFKLVSEQVDFFLSNI